MRIMYADFGKWLKWVGLFLILMAFPAFLIILSKEHGDMVPGLLIGIAAYYLLFHKKAARYEADREEGVSDGKDGNCAAGQL
ncbi:MAG: hypothetical protein K6E30_06215 [Lachnospiraceae bacterium]|nr:hypothetical protein [Lachnospiraceae bacterium]